jgi:hypothetical protein
MGSFAVARQHNAPANLPRARNRFRAARCRPEVSQYKGKRNFSGKCDIHVAVSASLHEDARRMNPGVACGNDT